MHGSMRDITENVEHRRRGLTRAVRGMVCAHHVAQIRSKLIQAATQLDLSLDFVTQGKDGIRAPYASFPGLPPPPNGF
jgi:hypothetical protein